MLVAAGGTTPIPMPPRPLGMPDPRGSARPTPGSSPLISQFAIPARPQNLHRMPSDTAPQLAPNVPSHSVFSTSPLDYISARPPGAVAKPDVDGSVSRERDRDRDESMDDDRPGNSGLRNLLN